MDDNQTILVKKADGSFIHVPLSELGKKPRETESTLGGKVPMPAVAVKVAPMVELAKEREVVEAPKSALVTPPRVIKLTEQVMPAKAVKILEPEIHDLTSPLEEPAPAIHPAMPLLSQGRENQVESIIKALSFKVPVQNGNRLRTIIQLFLKDIRGENETLEILTRKELEGGVGLSASQAEEVINKSEESNSVATEATKTPVILSEAKDPLKPNTRDSSLPLRMTPKFDPKESMRLEKEIPDIIRKFPIMKPVTVAPKAAPASVSTPVLPPKVAPVSMSSVAQKIAPVVMPKVPLSEMPLADFKFNSDRLKTTMHDVTKPPLEITPADEIRYFSLTDFRRLAPNPADGALKLKQKFLNLKDESVILFFAALEAWRSSPLYRDYLTAVSQSLSKRTPLARSGDKLMIQLPEIVALVEMEKEFG